MRNKFLFFLMGCFCLIMQQHTAYGQYFQVKDIAYQTVYHFPLLKSKTQSANRINDYLWGMQLRVLPGLYQGNPYDLSDLPEGNSLQGTSFISYKIFRNDAKVFSIKISSEYLSAGVNDYEHIYNFDPQTGNPLLFMDFFTEKGYLTIRQKIIDNRKRRLENYLKTLDTTANGNIDSAGYKVYKHCLQAMKDEDPNEDDMIIKNDTIKLQMASCGDTHYFQAEDTAHIYKNVLPVHSLLSYMNDYGKCFFSKSSTKCSARSKRNDEQMVFKGTLNGRYKITLVIFNYFENTCYGAYFYDTQGKAIRLTGEVEEDGSIRFHTPGSRDKETMTLKKMPGGGFKGTWSKGKLRYPVLLK